MHSDILPGTLDWILLATLSLAVPVLSLVDFRHLRARLTNGDAAARLVSYCRAISLEWSALVIVIVLWRSEGREFTALGLAIEPSTGLVVTTVLVALAVAGLLIQVTLVRERPETLASVRGQMAGVGDVMPRTRPELRAFLLLSGTAGIVEEIVYRGYLMAVLRAVGGPVIAVVGSTLIFTAGHAYQPATIVRVAAIGLVSALLVLWSASVLPLIVLHATIDATSGTIGYYAFRSEARSVALDGSSTELSG